MYKRIIFLMLLLIGAAPLRAASVREVGTIDLTISTEPSTALPNQPVTVTYNVTASDGASNIVVHEMMGDGCSRQTNANTTSCQRSAAGGYLTSMAYAMADAGEPITSTMATATVEILETSVVLAVAPSVVEASAGQSVAFSYTITNTGSADLTNITLSDKGNAACATTLDDLAAGAVTTYQCSLPMSTTNLSTHAHITAIPVNGAYLGDEIQSSPLLATINATNVPTAAQFVGAHTANTGRGVLLFTLLLLIPTAILWVKRRRAVLLLLLAGFAVYVIPLQAAPTCAVPADYPTIQAAIDDAACAEINVASGYYAENLQIQRDVILRGTPYQAIVDGQGAGSVIWVSSGENVVIDSFILQNGRAESGGGLRVTSSQSAEIHLMNSVLHSNSAEIPAGGNGWGGAVYNYHSNVTLTDNHLQGNSSHFGGAITQHGPGTMTLVRTTLFANSAHKSGGGLMVQDGTAIVEDSWIVNNNAGQQGGGFFNNQGTLRIHRSGIQANFANEGGGILNYRGQMTVTGSSIVGHSAADGSGVLNDGQLILIHSTSITDNGGNVGVALFNRNGTLILERSSVMNNTGGYGAALYATAGKVILYQSSITDNHAYEGGALYIEGTANVEPIQTSFINNSASTNGGVAYVKSGIFGGDSGTYFGFNQAERGGAIHADSNASVGIRNGSFEFNRAEIHGGAIFCPGGFTGGSLHFLANEALYGGAIYGTDITLNGGNSTFTSNRAVVGAGAALLSGPSTISNVVFNGNSAGTRGGAVETTSDNWISTATFNGNTAQEGGAIYNTGRLITGSMILTDNGANSGGAVYNRGIVSLGMVNLFNNRATVDGSAVWSDGQANILQSQISGNLNSAGVHNANNGVVNFTDTTISTHAFGNCSGNIANITAQNLTDDDGTCQP